MSGLICLMCVLSWPANYQVQTLPEELMFLHEFMSDEKKMEKAVRTFDKKMQTFSHWDINLAKTAKENGDQASADEHLNNAQRKLMLAKTAYEYGLQYFDKNARLHNFYGELLYDRVGEETLALKEWKLAHSYDTQWGAPSNNLGLHYCHVGEFRWGLAYFDDALRVEPNNPDYLFNLTQIYLTYDGDVSRETGISKTAIYEKAMKMSQKAADVANDEYDIVRDYAFNFFASERFKVKVDWKKGAKAWQKTHALARTVDENFNSLLYEARCWMRAKSFSPAIKCLEEALKIRPESEVAHSLLVDARQGKDPVVLDDPSPRD